MDENNTRTFKMSEPKKTYSDDVYARIEKVANEAMIPVELATSYYKAVCSSSKSLPYWANRLRRVLKSGEIVGLWESLLRHKLVVLQRRVGISIRDNKVFSPLKDNRYLGMYSMAPYVGHKDIVGATDDTIGQMIEDFNKSSFMGRCSIPNVNYNDNEGIGFWVSWVHWEAFTDYEWRMVTTETEINAVNALVRSGLVQYVILPRTFDSEYEFSIIPKLSKNGEKVIHFYDELKPNWEKDSEGRPSVGIQRLETTKTSITI